MARDYIDRLSDYADQIFPGLAGRMRENIQGATPEEIAALEQLVGQPLPPAYRLYLERMGHAGFTLARDGSSSIYSVLGYYQEAAANRWKLPPNCLIVGPGDRLHSVALQLPPGGNATDGASLDRASGPGEDPRVVFVQDKQGLPYVEGPWAESLEKLVFRQFFSGIPSKSRFPWFGSLHVPVPQGQLTTRSTFPWVGHADSPNRLGEVSEAAQALGFAHQWFSDQVVYCGYRGDAVLMALQEHFSVPHDSLEVVALRLWAQQEAVAQQIADELAHRLGVSGFRIIATLI